MIEEAEPVRCPDVDMVVIDRDLVRVALAVDDWNATTILACVSEDPADWSELADVWIRYRSGRGADQLEGLDFVCVEFRAALGQLANDRAWIAIDMRTKRVCVGKANDPMERDGCYVSDELDPDGEEARIPVHLPPWWEFNCPVDLSVVDQSRRQELQVVQPRREIVWGPALTAGLADLMAARFVADGELRQVLSTLATEFSSISEHDELEDAARSRLIELRNQLHAETVRVHRDWLMTPRRDLNGLMPRQCLHGGLEWIDRIIDGQKMRVSSDLALTTPLPEVMAKNPCVPMGRSEICLYFDLCRELIHSGWIHLSLCCDHSKSIQTDGFADYLAQVKQSWMRMSYEGGDSPECIIDAERFRVPRVLDAEHAGVIDCDCPICEMMKTGDFGPSFEGIDGHHLELDGEFAFSLHETLEEWEESQREFEDISRSMSEAWDAAECESEEDADDDDEFGSVWKNTYVGQNGIPGDTKGHIGISFLLADMIGSLKQLTAQSDIDELNQAFREYRTAGQYELAFATEHFQQVLESVAQRHPELVSRSADLQHRLDELARRVNKIDSDFESENDMPF